MKACADTLASSAANQGDNTVSVAQGGTATPGASIIFLLIAPICQYFWFSIVCDNVFQTRCAACSDAEILRPAAEEFIEKSMLTDVCLLVSPSQVNFFSLIFLFGKLFERRKKLDCKSL